MKGNGVAPGLEPVESVADSRPTAPGRPKSQGEAIPAIEEDPIGHAGPALGAPGGARFRPHPTNSNPTEVLRSGALEPSYHIPSLSLALPLPKGMAFCGRCCGAREVPHECWPKPFGNIG